MSEPEVSVVIPCYGGARYLGQAIESCLRQTLSDLEVLVVDDASPDDCAAIAERYARQDSRVRLIRHERNGGVARAFNTGFRQARGRYFARLAQDDFYREDALEIMAAALRERPEVGLAYCHMQLVNAEGEVVHPMLSQPPATALFPASRLGLCVMWPRHVWERVGEFEPRCDTSEDYDYWLRISRHFPLHLCGDELPFFYRHHPGQLGVRKEQKQKQVHQLCLLRYWSAELRDRPTRLRNWVKVGLSASRWLSLRARSLAR